MQKLQLLEHSLLTESVRKALAQSRITTILDFLQEDTEKLSILSRLNITEILTLRSHIFSKYSAPLINGTTLISNSLQGKRTFIKTGLQSLDTLLNGGIPLGYITEICGLADSGKTQLCLQLSINCVKDTNNIILYVDTKGDFSAIRIQKILDAQGFSHMEMAVIMHKIKVVHVWTMEEVIDLLLKIKNNVINIPDLTMILIDSLPCLMFQYLGDDNKIGLVLLNKFVNCCRWLCSHRFISVICINIQTRWVEQDVSDLEDEEQSAAAYKETMFVEKLNRCLGNYWRHVPAFLLLQEKYPNHESSDSHNICITNVSSWNGQNNKCLLTLNSSGLLSLPRNDQIK